MNFVPRSELIDNGTPCILTISLTYNLENSSAYQAMLTRMKLAHLVVRSIITHIELLASK